jgi:hypothetical protein
MDKGYDITLHSGQPIKKTSEVCEQLTTAQQIQLQLVLCLHSTS